MLRVWNPKAGKRYKLENALKDGIRAMLYPGTGTGLCQSQPALLPNGIDQEKFQKIESDFFDKNGRWRSYSREAAVGAGDLIAKDSKDLMVFRVQVSRNELRKYLEEMQVIKQLNNGF